jgi:hypothetical protein
MCFHPHYWENARTILIFLQSLYRHLLPIQLLVDQLFSHARHILELQSNELPGLANAKNGFMGVVHEYDTQYQLAKSNVIDQLAERSRDVAGAFDTLLNDLKEEQGRERIKQDKKLYESIQGLLGKYLDEHARLFSGEGWVACLADPNLTARTNLDLGQLRNLLSIVAGHANAIMRHLIEHTN